MKNVNTRLNIQDKWLREAFKEHCSETEFTVEDLRKIKVFRWDESQVEGGDIFGKILDLSGFEHLKNVTGLEMNGNGISSIEQMTELTKLKEIWLEGNNILTIPILNKLTELTKLDLTFNYNLKSIANLANHPSLEHLYLSRTKVNDISVLETLPNLKTVTLYRCPIDFTEGNANYTTVVTLLKKGIEVQSRGIDVQGLKREILESIPSAPNSLATLLKEQGAFDVLEKVLQFGANGGEVDLQSTRGETLPLHLLLKKPDEVNDLRGIVSRLVKEGADINKLNANRETALAVYLRNFPTGAPYTVTLGNTKMTQNKIKNIDFEFLKFLIDLGAKVDSKVLMVALNIYELKSNNQILDYLHKDFKEIVTQELFYKYCENGHLNYVKSILESDNLDREYKDYQLPPLQNGLNAANHNGHMELSSYLESIIKSENPG